MKNFLKIIGLIFICFLPGIIGGYFTANNLYPWFSLLIKPSFSPPSWIFSPVWTSLYTLMGISLFLVLKADDSKNKIQGVVFFAIQLVLNGLWSIVFFGLHQILLAFVVIIALLVFIILSVFQFYKVSKYSAYLLIPYVMDGSRFYEDKKELQKQMILSLEERIKHGKNIDKICKEDMMHWNHTAVFNILFISKYDYKVLKFLDSFINKIIQAKALRSLIINFYMSKFKKHSKI